MADLQNSTTPPLAYSECYVQPFFSFYNADNMAIMKTFKDKEFDLTIVDPPYGININMNMGRRKGEKAKHKVKQWDKGIPEDEYFAELMRISKNQIIWGGNYFSLPLTGAWIFWNKNVPEGVSFADGELAWTSFDMVLKKINHTYTGFNGMDEGGKIHPTQKPIDLYRWILQNYAEKGNLILDTHLGSGSSRIAAYEGGFNFVGFEIDAEYYEKQEKRFNTFISQLTLW